MADNPLIPTCKELLAIISICFRCLGRYPTTSFALKAIEHELINNDYYKFRIKAEMAIRAEEQK